MGMFASTGTPFSPHSASLRCFSCRLETTNVIVFELSGSINTDWKEWDELGKHAACLETASSGTGKGGEVSSPKTAFQSCPGAHVFVLHEEGEAQSTGVSKKE